jgi:uncharacterized protein (DUF1330 family)
MLQSLAQAGLSIAGACRALPECANSITIRKGVTRMAHYLIAQVKVNDDVWIPEYAASVHTLVEKHGGKYLSRSGNITKIEGDNCDADLVAVIQFPSMEALQAFVSDPEYAPYAAARQAGTDSQFIAIDATDVAGTIPYLTPGG